LQNLQNTQGAPSVNIAYRSVLHSVRRSVAPCHLQWLGLALAVSGCVLIVAGLVARMVLLMATMPGMSGASTIARDLFSLLGSWFATFIPESDLGFYGAALMVLVGVYAIRLAIQWDRTYWGAPFDSTFPES
jgi:hypothetical protein